MKELDPIEKIDMQIDMLLNQKHNKKRSQVIMEDDVEIRVDRLESGIDKTKTFEAVEDNFVEEEPIPKKEKPKKVETEDVEQKDITAVAILGVLFIVLFILLILWIMLTF